MIGLLKQWEPEAYMLNISMGAKILEMGTGSLNAKCKPKCRLFDYANRELRVTRAQK